MATKNLGRVQGLSAYEVWLEQGNTGTEEDFLNSLKGEGTTENSIFAGLTASFYGDSLTEENWHYTKGYHSWVQDILGLSSYNNYGKSGNKISDVYEKINSISDNADIIFVMCGVNDQNYSISLGEFGDTGTDTSYGAIDSVCSLLKTKYPTKPIIFITPHYQNKYPHNEGITSYEISKAIKEVCEKYSIIVYDNFVNSGIYSTNLDYWTTDNCHWNDKAHEMLGKNLSRFVLNTLRYNWEVVVLTLDSISATYNQGTNVVYTTDSLDSLKQYLVVTANYDNGTSSEITNYTLSGSLVEGTNTITVTYLEKTTTFTVTTTPPATLDSISVVFNSDDTEFTTATVLEDLEDYLVVTAYYSDDTTRTVTDYTLSGTLVEGTNTITVTYGGKTTTFEVVIVPEEEEIPVDYSQWIGKTVTVTKGSPAYLTALIEVDDDIIKGSNIDVTLSGTDCVNMTSKSQAGGPLFGDNSGEVDNGEYSGQLQSVGPTQTQTVTDSTVTWSIPTRTISDDVTCSYVKVLFILQGTPTYSFKISDISVSVNGKQKEILKLGAFFTSDKEQITIN